MLLLLIHLGKKWRLLRHKGILSSLNKYAPNMDCPLCVNLGGGDLHNDNDDSGRNPVKT